MPELPDVEVYRRRLRGAMRGRRIEGVAVADAQVLVDIDAGLLDQTMSGARIARRAGMGRRCTPRPAAARTCVCTSA